MLSSARVQQRLARRTIALVLAGGRGSRLKQLTDRRAKPAVFFGGKFRIIDFALSNCLNSNIRRIAVLTQYKAHSLLRHLQMGWSFLRPEMNEFLDLLPAQQRLDEATWYRGTGDAVYQNFDILKAARPEFFVVLAGDHIYKMDYSNMLADLRSKGADCIVACVEVPIEQASEFGIMQVDQSMRVVDFLEKPDAPPSIAGKPDRALASMGIYAFSADFLYAELQRDHDDASSSHDFGKDLLPRLVARGEAVFAYRFNRYWQDVGTLDSYYESNLQLLSDKPPIALDDPDWIIHTQSADRPPVRFAPGSRVANSMIANGCRVEGAVERSILFPGVHVPPGAEVRDSIVMHDTRVGRGAWLDRVIIDKEVEIGEGARVGSGQVTSANLACPDHLSSGLTVVGKGAHVPDGIRIGRNARIGAYVRASSFGQDVPCGGVVDGPESKH